MCLHYQTLLFISNNKKGTVAKFYSFAIAPFYKVIKSRWTLKIIDVGVMDEQEANTIWIEVKFY